jgi:hypothetical protein
MRQLGRDQPYQLDGLKRMGMLYRGQNRSGHDRNNGVVYPKGSSLTVVPRFDGSWVADGKFTYGESENNAVRAHHIDTGKWNGCFISTTRNYEVARYFATTDNTCDGVIYHIDETLFDRYGVVASELSDLLYAGETEVSVRSEDCGPLPPEIIVRIDEVSPL